MPSTDTVQPHRPWSHEHDNQYGWNSLTRLHPYTNRALTGAIAFASFVAYGAGHGPARVLGTVPAVVLIASLGLMLLSTFARFARSPRCVYRLRDASYRVLYVGRTRNWTDRIDAHTDTAEDHDDPWRWKIDTANSAPFKWCLTPWGEWLSERFRIRQAATLAAIRVAPKVHNDRRQHGRPYRSPMAVWAVALWIAEELLFGSQPQAGAKPVEEEDPQDSDNYEPDSVEDDDTPTPSTDSTDASDNADGETVNDVFARLVSEGWPEGFPECPEPSPGERGYGPGPGCPGTSTSVGGGTDQPCPNPDPAPGTGHNGDHSPTPDQASNHDSDQAPSCNADAGPVGERGADATDAGSSQSQPGAGGGKPCAGNGFGAPCPDGAQAAKGPRCVECHRSYEKTRKDRLRKRTRNLFGEDDAE